MTLREEIYVRMVKLGVRQTQMAKDLGLSVANLSSYLNGRRPLPYNRMEKVCEYLGLMLAGNSEVPQKNRPFHSVIRSIIKERGLSQKGIAEATGMNSSSLCSYLTGERSISNDRLDDIVCYLGLRLVPIEGWCSDSRERV